MERGRGVVALGIAALVALGCSPGGTSGAVEPDPSLVARRSTFQQRMLLTGTLEAVHSEKIVVPRTPAWRVEIRWMESDGAQVTAGQPVLALDNSQFTTELDQNRLARAGAYSDLVRKRAERDATVAEQEFQFHGRRIALEKARIKAAVPAELRPAREYQEDQLALVRAEHELAKAQDQLETSRAALEAEIEELEIALERSDAKVREAEQAIEAMTLRAPRDGILIVSENRGEGRKFQVGDGVWVGLAVAEIPDLEAVRVAARLSDVDDGRVVPGMQARCTLDTYPDQVFDGYVTALSPVAQEDARDSLRRSFRVDIRIDRADPRRVRPGMSVKAELLAPPVEDALVAPRVALDLSTAGAVRALLADGSDVEVEVGDCNAQECTITSGLTEGDRLRARG